MMRAVFYCVLLCCLCLISGCGAKSTETSPQATPMQSATATTTTADSAATADGATAPQSAQANAVDATSSVNEQQYVAAQSAMTNTKAAACALITSAEIEAVQGEAVRDIKGNDRENGGLTVSQCFYTLPTFSKSISLQLTRNASGKGKRDAVREFWNQSFHRDRDKDKDRDKDHGKDKDRGKDRDRNENKNRSQDREEEEEENKVPPQFVTGLGREAFWVRGGVAAAIYVLKNDNVYFRLSLGGADAEPIKIDKAKRLAQKALKRL